MKVENVDLKLTIFTQLITTNSNDMTSALVLVQVQVLVLDLSSPTSLQFGLRTFFVPDSVHV